MPITAIFKITTVALYAAVAIAQPEISNYDSLKQKSYADLKQCFFKAKGNATNATAYAEAWLSKAKAENNSAQMALAYKAMAYGKTKQTRDAFTDSMVTAALHTKDNAAIAAAYLTKGIAQYENMDHQRALDNFITADAYISNQSDPYLLHKVKYQIAQTKYHLGFYHEAIALLLQCVNYYQEENDLAYLNSLYALGLCYNSISDIKASNKVNEIGIQAAHELLRPKLLPYFHLSQAINNHHQKKYNEAINTFLQVIPALNGATDKSNLTVAYFYLAKSYWNEHELERALPYLKKVDEIFNEQKYIRPDLLENYVLLINYYKLKSDSENMFLYVNKMMEAEKIITRDYKYLSSKILGKYNSKKLNEDLQQVAKNAYNLKLLASVVIIILSSLFIFQLYNNAKNRKRHRKIFEELMSKNQKTDASKANPAIPYNESELGISQERADALLKKLELFEKQHSYKEPDMNLAKLALKLNTNQKYVTKILAHYRNKGIIEYISDLKIEYIVNKLQNDKKFRNYKNQALSDEAGFGSTQIFTKTFKSKIGMPPTAFIRELKNSEQES